MNITLDSFSEIVITQADGKCCCAIRSATGRMDTVLEKGEALNIRQSCNLGNPLAHCPFRGGSGGWGGNRGTGGIGMANGHG